jgi:tetratricopeptide (TPR) repeat protein
MEKGDDLRNHWRCRRAASQYKYALYIAVRDQEQSAALHMLGVTYKMWGKLGLAERSLRKALNLTVDPVGRGNVLRDLADTLSLHGDHRQAMIAADQSLSLLKNDPVARASSLGFKGRLLQRSGKIDEALTHYADAREQLNALNAGAPELFNIIPYINALYEAGQDDVADSWLLPAMVLCNEYGAWVHRLRLKVLQRFGHRGDNVVQRLLPFRRFIPFL